jgi:hypothetical protein
VRSQELLPRVLAEVQQAPEASGLRRHARDPIHAHVFQYLQTVRVLSDVRDRPVREAVCREDVDNVVRNLQRQLGAEVAISLQILMVLRIDVSEEPILLLDSICPRWMVSRKFITEWINWHHTKFASHRSR